MSCCIAAPRFSSPISTGTVTVASPPSPAQAVKITSNKRKQCDNYKLPQKVAKLDPKPRQTFYNELWAELYTFIKQIYEPIETRKKLSEEDFFRLYTSIHKLCTMKPDEPNYRSLRRFNESVPAPLLSLYTRISRFYKSHLEKIAGVGKQLMDPKEILTFYSKQCHDFYSSSKILNGICAYLNRSWSVNQQLREEKGLGDIYALALNHWRDTLFKILHKIVTSTILEIILQDRYNQVEVNAFQGEIREVIDSYVAIGGFAEANKNEENLSIYQKYFEKEFLDTTTKYYEDKIRDVIDETQPEKTLLAVENIILSEEDRVEKILHQSTSRKVVVVCLQTLVLDNINIIYSVFKQILEAKNDRLLTSLFGIISRVSPEEVTKMANKFQQHLTDLAIIKLNTRAETVKGEKAQHPAEQFCLKLIEFITDYKKIVTDTFANKNEFSQALDQACVVFLNQKQGELANVSRYIAHFANIVMTKRGKNTDDIQVLETLRQQSLTHVANLVRFLEDKDMFERVNIACMQNRLIDGTSSSNEIETFFIKVLNETGMDKEYTRKLKTTFQDTMNNSRVENEAFKNKFPTQKGEPDLFAYVLDSATCTTCPRTEFLFPDAVRPTIANFEKYYDERHSKSRKLNWIAPKCTGEITFEIKKIKYLLIVSVYEMAILLLFDKADQHTLKEIGDLTKLEKDKLEAVIKNLVKAKLLLEEKPSEEAKPEEIIIKFNQGFEDKRRRIKLNIRLKSEAKQEQDKIDEDVKKSREYQIQSLIVRIMKGLKECGYQNLLTECCKECQAQCKFSPEIPTIKKQIAYLHENEYLIEKGTEPGQQSVLRENGTLVYVS